MNVDIYRSYEGIEIELTVPWEASGSSIIPPPSIEFYLGNAQWRTFWHQGPKP